MKHKSCAVHIWFLDADLQASARMLTDRCLGKSIDACINSLTAACMYLAGIRSKKFYSYFFSKENIDSTLRDKFAGWPLKKAPSFCAYTWREAKWCRMCHENYDYAVSYLECLLDEHTWRHSCMHKSSLALDWFASTSIAEDFPYAGIDNVVLPWKCVSSKFRSQDIIEGYRREFCATQIEDGDAFAAYARCKRDIPQFVVDTFKLDTAFER